jgi:uncharacterized protein (TIGR02145 family)
MKTIYNLLLILLVYPGTVFGQVPHITNYQAVIRDNTGQIIANTEVKITIDILQGSPSGGVTYTDVFFPVTDEFGLVNLTIGTGDTAAFSLVDWQHGPFFIRVSLNDTEMGTSQLVSVPYALFAERAGNAFNGDYNQLINKPDFTLWDKDSTDNVHLTGDQTIAGNKTFTGTISAGNNRITSVGTPSNNSDAANKAYVDAVLQELSRAGAIAIDADGNIYSTVRIGSQVWMGENLKTTKYNDGTNIPLVTDSAVWFNLTTPAYCWYENDEATYGNTYGALYNWYAVETGKLCPTGWHVPKDGGWSILSDYLGGESVAGGKMKEIGLTHWQSPNAGADNSSGFTALPSGARVYLNPWQFNAIGYAGGWWSSTEYSSSQAYASYINTDYDNLFLNDYVFKIQGLSVRCVKDVIP